MFVHENANARKLHIRDLSFSVVEFEAGFAQVDVVLEASEEGDGINVNLQYNTSLFTEDTIRRWGAYYERILAECAADWTTPIKHIDVMSIEEKTELLEKFNDTRRDYPLDKTIHQLFTDQADRTPEHVAVQSTSQGENRSNGSYRTYNQLNHNAGQCARTLEEQGIGPGSIVAVKIEHSIEMIIAILGILKAGAAYLPIDPDYPQDRIDYMLKDSGAALLIDGNDLHREAKNDVPTVPGSVAYVIYTSGSTGRPKGVVVRHRELVNYVTWASETYVRGEALNFPLFTSISFDLTVTSLFTPLVTGNTVIIYEEPAIDRMVEDPRIGVMKVTPSHLKLIRDKKVSNPGLKRFIVGGEALPLDLAQDIHRNFHGNVELYNEYGPTEATVGCMIYRFDPDHDIGATVPVGKPAANAQIYLLDKYQNPVSPGVVGEMVITGDCLAAGYLNHPQLTAEVFTPVKSFWESRTLFPKRVLAAGGVFYGTGDLGRFLEDGNIEFLGRVDQQVKIRGFRIEIGEIEARLLEHEVVLEAVVTANEDENQEPYLCAYTRTERDLTVSEVREYLAGQLPDYMVPSYVIRLESIPLDHNGKVDRKRLPAPGGERPELEAEYVEPGSDPERQIAVIWQDILHLDKVGIHDNFFDLGGNSLMIAQVNSRLKELPGTHKDVSVVTLFRYPTVRALAEYLRQDEAEARRLWEERLLRRSGAVSRGKSKLKQKRSRIRRDRHD
jgi:amino acid adenylation domain-containing protein